MSIVVAAGAFNFSARSRFLYLEAMRNQLRLLYGKWTPKLRPLFRALVCLPVHAEIWITDQMFLMSLRNPIVGRPSAIGMLFAFQGYLWRAIKVMWSEAYTEYTLHLYSKRNLAHYAKNGRGYRNVPNLSDQERIDQFAKLESRLEAFVDNYPMMVNYIDGESFLDAGCGKGESLKFVLGRFPHSPCTGFDIDERCLEVARIGTEGCATSSLRHGSILDFHFLKSFEAKSVDHVCVCHVFSTLLSPTMDETKLSHQRIIDEFVRMSRKSIMIIDHMSLSEHFEVKIEQLTRATICEDIASYFVKHRLIGETCVLSCQHSRAVLFKARQA